MPVNLFDANFYRAANSDLANFNDAQALSHFQNFGLNEERRFSQFADLNFYRSSYSDLASFSNRQAFDHLQNYGVAESRQFSQFFNVNYYRANNSDLAGLNSEGLLLHFLNYGLGEGRQFSNAFDVNFYRGTYSDLASVSNRGLYEHFQLYGLPNEGRGSSSIFSVRDYMANNPDAAGLNYWQAYQNYVLQDTRAGNPGKVPLKISPESPSSPGPGAPVNLVAPDGWNVNYDNSIWVSATKDFNGGAFSINFQDDPYFENGGVDEKLILEIGNNLPRGWGFIQETYTANERERTATIRLSPTSNIKTATLNIIDDDWNNDYANKISINDTITFEGGNSNNLDRYLSFTSSNATNSGATKEPNEPNHDDKAGGGSVWWSWTAPVSRIVEISTQYSSFDTLLGVYTGSSLPGLTRVVSNDNDPDRLNSSDRYSRVLLNAVAGTTYQIAVDGFNGATGSISLNLEQLERTFSQPNSLTITDRSTVNSPLSLSGLPGSVADVNVEMFFSHPYHPDLDVFLISPDNTRVELFTDVGTRVLTNTTVRLDDEGFTPIASEVNEISGTIYRPEGSLANFDGKVPNGTWSLEITDDTLGDTGTLYSWSLAFNLQP